MNVEKLPGVDYITVPRDRIAAEVEGAIRAHLTDHRKVAEILAAAGVDVEKLIAGIKNNAAQRVAWISLEDLAEIGGGNGG